MALGMRTRASSVDFHRLATSMTKEIDEYWLLCERRKNVTEVFSIQRIPRHLLEISRNAYEPIILSVGPYHHGTETLTSMEKEKWNCLDFMLKLNCQRSLQDYLNTIAQLEKQTRYCYAEEVKLDKKKFLPMLLLDGCFILVFLNGIEIAAHPSQEMTGAGTTFSSSSGDNQQTCITGKYHENHRETGSSGLELELSDFSRCQQRSRDNNETTIDHNDQVSNSSSQMGAWQNVAIAHDLLLLENQIPFFVVEKIHELVSGRKDETRLLRDRIARCLESILRHYPIADEPTATMKFHHLLHWCHICFRPSKNTEHQQHQISFRYFHRLIHFGKKFLSPGTRSTENQQRMLPIQQMDCFQAEHLPNRWRRAVQYHEAGVRLKKREYDSHNKHSLLDIEFSNGEVNIPTLPVDENTESLLKNLIALEQTDLRFGNDITAYICFMSQLVSTPDDATLLSQKGVIVHMMDNDEEVSALFTRLIQQVTINADGDYYLKSLCHELEAHYQSRLNRWIAWLWLNHFSNPWLAMAVLAAVVVLICTIVQTIFTILAYLKPPA